jgi:hypothetical protein
MKEGNETFRERGSASETAVEQRPHNSKEQFPPRVENRLDAPFRPNQKKEHQNAPQSNPPGRMDSASL